MVSLDRTANDALLEDDPPLTVTQSIGLSKTPLEHFDRAMALRHLEKTNPETLALAREWGDVVRDVMHVQQRLDKFVDTIWCGVVKH